ncbi:PH domain-containing protein [Corynebacterium epidermidicanis]|nr:PH domain-containing protein [Corynebacterium epidermidicanis]
MSSSSSAPAAKPQASAATTFATDRTHLIGAVVMGMISLLVIGVAPLKLGWILLLPVLFTYWVVKSKTVVDNSGITAHYAFHRPRQVTWEDFAGIRFGGSKTFARAKDNTEFALPGITFNSLPKLSEASDGRIVDALSAGKEAANKKVVIIHRDGRQVLKEAEES